MANNVKCRICGKQVDKADAIELRKGWYICSEKCRDEWQEKHNSPTNQKQDNCRSAILAYIKQLDPNANFMVITAQLKRMVSDYGMTYKGMHYALWYSVNIKNLPYKGVGILPYVYQESKDYWDWQQRMKQQMAGWVPADDDAVIVRQDKEEDVFT